MEQIEKIEKVLQFKDRMRGLQRYDVYPLYQLINVVKKKIVNANTISEGQLQP